MLNKITEVLKELDFKYRVFELKENMKFACKYAIRVEYPIEVTIYLPYRIYGEKGRKP